MTSKHNNLQIWACAASPLLPFPAGHVTVTSRLLPGSPREAGGQRQLKMTARGSPSRFLQSVLQNGVGRYVCQLKRLTLVFSKDAQPSRGAREYIEEKVVDFANQNPGIVVYISPKPCRVPKLVAEYLNGSIREEPINRKTAEEIAQLIQKMANQSGLDIIRIRKPYHTDSPSIQGQWHPFTNKPTSMNLRSFDAISQQTNSP
ncbi:large ribosomal subunit protein mL43 isoform X1 [Dendrobates tinctorius]|uniref:large ribosomal subunit protein mL43 isoform X1 n=1 Tax=Dendrobates tinctorius TaxID=92724 RepID=UPI003CCA4F88